MSAGMGKSAMIEKAERKPLSPEDKIVRLNGKIYKVVPSKRPSGDSEYGPRLEEVTPDDIAEFTVLGISIDGMAEKNIEELLQGVQSEVLERAKQNLKQTVIKALGFNDSWGRWEVETSDRRSGYLDSLLAQKTKEFILNEQLQVNDFFEGVEKDKLKEAIVKAIREHVSRFIRDNYRMENIIGEMIRNELKDQMQTFIKDNVMELMYNKMKGKQLKAADLIAMKVEMPEGVEIEEVNPYLTQEEDEA